MYRYYHDTSKCYCKQCYNASYNEQLMCMCCYDDNNILYYCNICDNIYNYVEIDNICIKYFLAVKKIEKFYIKYKTN